LILAFCLTGLRPASVPTNMELLLEGVKVVFFFGHLCMSLFWPISL
jgi:hypothetical protein